MFTMQPSIVGTAERLRADGFEFLEIYGESEKGEG